MIFKMCIKCKTLYTIHDGEDNMTYCHNYFCNGFDNDCLVTLDELIAPEIAILNQLGLETAFSCSGHRLNKEQISYPYVAFKKGIEVPNLEDPEIDYVEENPECNFGIGLYAKNVTYENVYEKALYFKNYLNKLIELLK